MPKQPLDLNLGQTEGSAAVRNVLMAIPEFSLVWQELTSLNLTTSQLTPVMPFLHQEERFRGTFWLLLTSQTFILWISGGLKNLCLRPFFVF